MIYSGQPICIQCDGPNGLLLANPGEKCAYCQRGDINPKSPRARKCTYCGDHVFDQDHPFCVMRAKESRQEDIRISELADQMTEREWRRILWCHRTGWSIVWVLSGASFVGFIVTAGIATAGDVAWIVPVICFIILISSAWTTSRWNNDTVPEHQAALLCSQRHVAKIEQREKERQRVVDQALEEIVADTGLGLGQALWEDAGRLK